MLEFSDVFQELEDFVYWLANREQRDQIHLMDPDELIGELFEEMWKVFLHYQETVSDMEQMKALMRQSFDNRVRELVYKYAVTHRAAKLNAVSLDGETFGNDDESNHSVLEGHIVMNIGASVRVDLDEEVISKMRVEETLERVSDNARTVLEAVLQGHPMLEAQLKLSGLRASEVYKGGGTVKIKKWHVSNALAMSEREVSKAFAEIRQIYEEVCNEYGD